MNKKNIILVIAVVIIVGAIWYLQAAKPPALSSGDIQKIALSGDVSDQTASTTQSGQSGQASSTPNSGSKAGSSVQASSRSAELKQKAAMYPSAVELIPGPGPGSNGFINSGPFTLKSLIGKKVILVDFWTYSCINCQRTVPYLNAWYDKYKDSGLVIVGVHTPEFDFEKDYNNVVKGTKELGIQYPVVQDNNYATWDAYGNRYWPHEYLIDIDGYVVHDKIGEGSYDETEQAIQAALQERATVLGTNQTIPTGIVQPKTAISMDGSQIQSQETYFGSDRNTYFGNGNAGTAGSQTLTVPAPASIQPNMFYLDGTWNIQSQFAQNTSQTAKIVYTYGAKNVYFVASSDNGVKAKILLDGKPISASQAGSDVAADGTVTIKDNRLYSLVNGTDYGTHTLEIDVEGLGLDAFTFTFG